MLPAASVPADFYTRTFQAVFCFALLCISDFYINILYDIPAIWLLHKCTVWHSGDFTVIIMYLFVYDVVIPCVFWLLGGVGSQPVAG